MQQSQSAGVDEWKRLCHRDKPTIEFEVDAGTASEDRDKHEKRPEQNRNNYSEAICLEEPSERISRRLSNYERPKSAPTLTRNTPIPENVPREILYEPERVIDLIKPHLKIILDYAQTYNLLVSEHTAVDCNFLELVPTLYRQVESQVTLHALCDTAPTGSTRRSRSGTPPTVHCAGPAVIRIKVLALSVVD